MASTGRPSTHPYLSGNFAPVLDEYDADPCVVLQGEVPEEMRGACYVRNGGNPVVPPKDGRHYHWFDGDGMLHGVFFPEEPNRLPEYTNKHLDTPIVNLSILTARAPLPSIALLVSPLSSLHKIFVAIVHTFLLAVQARVGTLSVANTALIWWETPGITSATPPHSQDEHPVTREKEGTGRLFATCESGPPLEVRVPSLQTVGWDRLEDPHTGRTLKQEYRAWNWKRFGLARLQDDWITAHPRRDPEAGELIFYGNQMFAAPYVRYSVVDDTGKHVVWKAGIEVGMAKMMHDFACSKTMTVIMNLPLTLSPMNLMSWRPQPLLHFDRKLPSEFIIFPRRDPSRVTRFVEPEPSMIFHTANAWDDVTPDGDETVNMLSCRFKSAKLVYAAGAVGIPLSESIAGLNDVVQLHYHQFVFDKDGTHRIGHSFPLSAIPFEFPNVRPDVAMKKARYVYGCTMRQGSFDERLGAAKVDCLVKLDVLNLVKAGMERSLTLGNPADERSVPDILAEQEHAREAMHPISIFALPQGFYAQEPRFVPRGGGATEDDGFILTYVYNEAFLQADGSASTASGSGSELWILDATLLHLQEEAVVAKIKLPQRVPYGLHGTFVTKAEIASQRILPEPLKPHTTIRQKVYRSSLDNVADIMFTRPSYREKSQAERIATSIMFPLSWIFLLLGIFEAASSGFVIPEDHPGGGATASSSIGSHHLGRIGGGSSGQAGQQELLSGTATFPWPQAASSILLLGSLLIMSRSSAR